MKTLINCCCLLVSFCSLAASPLQQEGEELLKQIHAQLSLAHGSFLEEYPEQLMSALFISENDKVLEIGGHVGRNSCVISSLLNHSENHVVLESDPHVIPLLLANREKNGLLFHIENAALSQVPLIQSGWNTTPSKIVLPGYFKIKTITYAQLKEKYGIPFNVLVADCEGALYDILRDDETVLEDVNMIIVENDYHDIKYFEVVRSKFIAHGFQLVYNAAGGWQPCYHVFYQVWKK